MVPILGTHDSSHGLATGSLEHNEYQRESGAVVGWVSLLGSFFQDVYAAKLSAENLGVMRSYLALGARDPHLLLRSTDFMDALDDEQRRKLVRILEEYSRDRVMTVALSLSSSLTIEQANSIKLLLTGGIYSPEERAQELIRVLESYRSGDLLSDEQKSSIARELTVIVDHKEIQARYQELLDSPKRQEAAALCTTSKAALE